MVGMGADLFGSFAESICATLVIASQIDDIRNTGWQALCFPIIIAAAGIVACLLTSILGQLLYPVRQEQNIDIALRLQMVLSAVLMIVPIFEIGINILPDSFRINGIIGEIYASNFDACVCVLAGTIAGMIIGFSAEYYTSNSFAPVRGLANACITGSATNIISGIALGYESVVLPTIILAALTYLVFTLCDLYGVALAAIGMLSTLATALTIDAFGPICDNAGGIAEMAMLPRSVRHKTDALDAAGNTTAAIGKGFAIGSAALVSIALFGAFTVRMKAIDRTFSTQISILDPLVFAFLMIGSNLPCWFTSMTMKSVGKAAMQMIEEVN